jgi:hypothetical protein
MKIYRGEAIKYGREERLRAFRQTLRTGFPTEFINGGNPYFIAQKGFFDMSVLHVAKDFKIGETHHLKHFISFSEDLDTARSYAHGSKAPQEYKEEVESRLNYEDITSTLVAGAYNFSLFDHYDHMIVTLDLSGGKPTDQNFDLGVIKEYNNGNSKILALKAYEYFSLQIKRMGKYVTEEVKQAAQYSKNDLEWLVLVLDLIPPQAGVPRSSSGLVCHGEPLTIKVCFDPIDSSTGDSAHFL